MYSHTFLHLQTFLSQFHLFKTQLSFKAPLKCCFLGTHLSHPLLGWSKKQLTAPPSVSSASLQPYTSLLSVCELPIWFTWGEQGAEAAAVLNTDALRLNFAIFPQNNACVLMCQCVTLWQRIWMRTEAFGKHDVLASVSHNILQGTQASWGFNKHYAE